MLLTKQKLLNDLQAGKTIAILYIFTFVGFVIPILPFWKLQAINANSIKSFILFTLVFGIPFGYFVGIRNIIRTRKLNKAILSGNITIYIDEIKSFRVTKHGTTDDMDDNYCRLVLKKYSSDGKSTVIVSSKEYDSLKKGDTCILIFAPKVKEPILVYPGNEYLVDSTLRSKVKDWRTE